jgi:hypothetical protein
MMVARCSIGWVGWLRRPAHRGQQLVGRQRAQLLAQALGALMTGALRWLIAHVRAPIALWRVV